MSRRLVSHLLIASLTLLGSLLPSAGAEEGREEPEAASLPAKIVAGKLIVSCDVSTRFRRIPVTLFVELETPCGLQLHNRAAAAIRAENQDGSTNPITVHLSDFSITVPKRELGPQEVYEDFTKYHSPELGEVALVGTIGAEILKSYHLVFDLHRGQLQLSAPKEADAAAATAAERATTARTTDTNGLVWFPTRFADGTPGAMALGTARYDSVIDLDLCESRGKAAGDVGPLLVGALEGGRELNVADYVALRPEEVRQVHADGVVGITGLNLLEHFRVEVDPVNRVIRFTETAPARFPKEDLAFFQARMEEDGDAVESYLTQHPDVRLSKEAAQLLVRLRLEEDADDDVFTRALKLVDKTQPEDLRASIMLDLMETLSEDGRPGHVIAAGRLGIESGRKDRYPDAVHKIHARLGALMLEAGESKEAWRHLLSAAFGMPEDGMVNLNLGRFYESGGRVRRAYSRYVQAVIQPETGAQALAGLQRLQAKLPGEERFSVDLVERLIAGKVENFGVATRYKPAPDAPKGHVVLVEFFTNGHLEGAQGGALANEGLLAHFSREHVAALSYNLPAPRLEPLVNELAVQTAITRGVSSPTVHLFDADAQGPGAGRSDFKERIYNALRREVLNRISIAAPFTLQCEARIEDGVVSGTLIVKGPKRRGTSVHLVLAERGVLLPGKSKVVIHRMVARASLLDGNDGISWKPTARKTADSDGGDADALEMKVEFSRALANIQAKNEAYLRGLEAAGEGAVSLMSTAIDPEQVSLVAYVRGATGQIVQAYQLDLGQDQ